MIALVPFLHNNLSYITVAFHVTQNFSEERYNFSAIYSSINMFNARLFQILRVPALILAFF
jgi:hypothetical protein